MVHRFYDREFNRENVFKLWPETNFVAGFMCWFQPSSGHVGVRCVVAEGQDFPYIYGEFCNFKLLNIFIVVNNVICFICNVAVKFLTYW